MGLIFDTWKAENPLSCFDRVFALGLIAMEVNKTQKGGGEGNALHRIHPSRINRVQVWTNEKQKGQYTVISNRTQKGERQGKARE